MTKKKSAIFKGMTVPELQDKSTELRTKLGKERSIKSSGTRPEKPATIKNLRRDIARCMTFIAQKQKVALKKAEEKK